MPFVAAIVHLAASYAGAVPLNSPTGEVDPKYVLKSAAQGTVGLILSSVITLTICVYTSIHLNLSTHGFSYIYNNIP